EFYKHDILKEILSKEKSNNEIDIDNEKEALEDLSLVNQIQLENEKEPVIGMKIHSIIKDIIEKYIDKETNTEKCIQNKKILEKLAKVVDLKMPEIDDLPYDDWNKSEIYYKNAHKLINLNLVQEIKDNENLAHLHLKIALYDENKLCSFENLIKYYENNLKISKTLYEGSHPDVASSLNNVGSSYDKLGVAQKRLEYRVPALEMHRLQDTNTFCIRFSVLCIGSRIRKT
ncbi:unnamed protein product, partial [Didymodactylos carnosus]